MKERKKEFIISPRTDALMREIREEGIFTQEDLKKVCHVN